MREKLHFGRLASTCSPIKKSWERPHFSVRFWYLLREFCWEPESVWYVSLWQHIHYPEQKTVPEKRYLYVDIRVLHVI